ncbi:hypothetical protein M0804_013262 [Polistes exclamans]|nr:hypothetical protein M0804_013262 [Polistes exclamans]
MDILKWLNQFEFITILMACPEELMIDSLINLTLTSNRNMIDDKNTIKCYYNLPYDVLVSKIQERYTIHDRSMSYILRFRMRDQFYGEPASIYGACLFNLLFKCNFNNGKELSFVLNRFIKGLRNKKTSMLLKRIPNLTFQKAIEIATVIELRKKHNRSNLLQ